jgi:hypothetical protein
MIAKITTPSNPHKALYYNEHKVQQKGAECIHAGNFLKEAPQLSLLEKKQRFDQLIALNHYVKLNTLHVSINFAPGENLSRERMIEIAEEYMERIGFGNQPYLVYQHHDAGHPHIHIVSTNILPDGNRIDMNFIGRDRSEPARKAIEEIYGLVKAEDQKKQTSKELRPLSPEKLKYGKSETKQAITNLLQYVLENYRYRSLAELNAILKLYNLRANPGLPGSRIHKHGGLVYQMLDDKGQPIGIPIKASSIYFKPGLQFLEKKFKINDKLPPEAIDRIRHIIDNSLRSKPKSWEEFVLALRHEQLVVVPYINDKGFCYGFSFVDLEDRLVLKASDLGKAYSSAILLKQLGLDPLFHRLPVSPEVKKGGKISLKEMLATQISHVAPSQYRDGLDKAMDILFRIESQQRLPYDLRQKKNKNRSRNL